MFQAITAVGSSVVHSIEAAVVATEPEVITIYALVGWFVWLVWYGNHNSGKRPPNDQGDADPVVESDEERLSARREASATSDRRKKKRKLNRAERRRRGHINWIQ